MNDVQEIIKGDFGGESVYTEIQDISNFCFPYCGSSFTKIPDDIWLDLLKIDKQVLTYISETNARFEKINTQRNDLSTLRLSDKISHSKQITKLFELRGDEENILVDLEKALKIFFESLFVRIQRYFRRGQGLFVYICEGEKLVITELKADGKDTFCSIIVDEQMKNSLNFEFKIDFGKMLLEQIILCE